MAKYRNQCMGQLAGELGIGLARLRKGYVDAAEQLALEIDDTQEYPFAFVLYRVTGYRRADGLSEPLAGRSLRQDLLRLMLDVCESFPLATSSYDETVYDIQALARHFSVSTKTIQRWRRRGLPTRRLVFPDGRRRLAFLDSSVRAFADRHRRQVKRSIQFTQLSEPQKAEILRRARRMVGFTRCTLSEVSRRIARQTGRAVETVRYTIRRHDTEHAAQALFPDLTGPLRDGEKGEIYQQYLDGASVTVLGRRYRRTRGSIYRIVNEMRARQLLGRPIHFVPNEIFQQPDAEEVILGGDGEGADGCEGGRTIPRTPGDLPPYLRALYEVPLLVGDQERNLFQRYNYLKYLADQLRRRIDVSNVTSGELKAIESLLLQANVLKNRIIRANLRLVVSIAKKHVHGPQTLFELISDGNVALMRAVEKFDYAKGYRFSTYSSWAIMRSFARSVPKERSQLDRFSTGHEAVLEIASSLRTYDPNELNIPELRESIDTVLSHLSSRERTILIDHFGLDESGEPKTFDELGKRLGISKERVRQIEIQALRKLRKILKPQEYDLLS